MTHILHIDASPRGERSHSRQLSREFMEVWRAKHPDATVTYRDLGREPVPPVSEAWIAAVYSTPTDYTAEQKEAIAISDVSVNEFLRLTSHKELLESRDQRGD